MKGSNNVSCLWKNINSFLIMNCQPVKVKTLTEKEIRSPDLSRIIAPLD